MRPVSVYTIRELVSNKVAPKTALPTIYFNVTSWYLLFWFDYKINVK